MKIYIGADHGGYSLKEVLKKYLGELGEEVFDKGADSLDLADDFPDFIAPVARAVSADPEGSRGIVLGRSGQGEAILANRFKNVRCALFCGGDMEIVKKSKEHNNANMLSLGADFLNDKTACEAVRLWLATPFTRDERHLRRLEKIEEMSLVAK